MNKPDDLFFLRLAQQLTLKLPGSVSHLKMLPPGRILQKPSGHQDYYESAVLVLLFPEGEDIRVCLTRRPATMKNHAGQIAFPGGKREKDDRDLVHTALREAGEEIGIDADNVRVIGLMSSVYVQVSDFLITPVLAWMDGKPEIRMDPSEVDEVIFISFCALTDETNLHLREMETRTGPINAPGFAVGECFIWGATAMILAELVDIFGEEISCKRTS